MKTSSSAETQQEESKGGQSPERADVISRLRLLKQPATLFGETDADRYQRLLACEESRASDLKKSERDETAKSFLPEDHDIELLKFMKEQEKLLKSEEKQQVYEEVKDDEEGDDIEMKVQKEADD